jgi:hypothetical protein
MSLASSNDNSSHTLLTCKEIIIETHDVKSFVFAYSGEKFTFNAGQYISFDININGEMHHCNYTLSSSPTDTDSVSITIKRVIDGKVSNYFHDHFNIGQTISIQKISGTFILPDTLPDKILFISAGSGITPMLSMLRFLVQKRAQSQIIFFHSAQSEADLIARREIQFLAQQHGHCEVVYTLTQSAKPRWLGFQGRVNESMLANIFEISKYHTFVCGPKGFRETVNVILRANGLSEENCYYESFGSHQYSRKIKIANNSTKAPLRNTTEKHNALPQDQPKKLLPEVSIYFKRWHKYHQGTQQQTLLEQGENAGLILPYSCRAGSCGRCKAKLVSGEVKQDCNDGLSAEEQQQGYILLCCSSPLTDVELSHEG